MREPAEALPVALTHHHRAHEDFVRADAVELYFALPGGRGDAQRVSELVLAHCAWCVDLVAENEEGHVRELVDSEEVVKLGLRLAKSFWVGCVDEEDDTVYFWEVVFPETTS